MWVISADAGSILSAVKLDAKRYPKVAKRHGALDEDTHYVVVRSRVKAAMQYFIETVDSITDDDTPTPILDTDGAADYKYRTVVTADELTAYLAFEVAGITYTSHFKEAAVARQPLPKTTGLYGALMSTWSAFSRLQDTAPYAGKRYTAPAKPAGTGAKVNSWEPATKSAVGTSAPDPAYKPRSEGAEKLPGEDDFRITSITRPAAISGADAKHAFSEDKVADMVDSVLGVSRGSEDSIADDDYMTQPIYPRSAYVIPGDDTNVSLDAMDEAEADRWAREHEVPEDWAADYMDEDGVQHKPGCAIGWGDPCDYRCADIDEHPSLFADLRADRPVPAAEAHPGESRKSRKRRHRHERQRQNRAAGTRKFR